MVDARQPICLAMDFFKEGVKSFLLLAPPPKKKKKLNNNNNKNTKHMLSRHILIGQSFVKPFETRDKSLGEDKRNWC